MKFQTTQTGKSYLLLIEQANELTELPQWLTDLNKPTIIVVPKKLMPLTMQAQCAVDEQQEWIKGVYPNLAKSNTAGEPCIEPLLWLSRRHPVTMLTQMPIRRGFAFTLWAIFPLIPTLIILVLLALVCAMLGLFFLHLGPPLTIPPSTGTIIPTCTSLLSFLHRDLHIA